MIWLGNFFQKYDTIQKICLSTLNVILKPIHRLHFLFTFWVTFLLNFYSTFMFWDPICSTLHYSILNLYFQKSSQYNNLFRSIYIISFRNGLSSLTLWVNSFISDFTSLGKSFMNIKTTNVPEEHWWVFSVFQNNCYQFLLSNLYLSKISYSNSHFFF